MSCVLTFAANAICLLSPTELTLRADASTQIAGDFSYRIDGRDYGGGTVGRIALDLPLARFRGWTLAGGIIHESLLDTTGDRGQERIYLGLQWRPFARGGVL